MPRYHDWARVLATGLPAANASITVYRPGTLVLSTIYDDDLSPPTAKANPFTADANAFFHFYSREARHDVRVAPVGTAAYTLGDVQLGNDFSFIFNVKSYGAVGDGVADDYVAINRAITEVRSLTTGGILYFPAGTYLIGTQLAFTAADTEFIVRGAGMDKTTIRRAPGMAAGPTIDITRGVLFEDFTVNNGGAGETAIRINATTNLHRIQLSNFAAGGLGIDVTSTAPAIRLSKIHATSLGQAQFLRVAGSSTQSGLLVEQCYAQSNHTTLPMIDIVGTQSCVFIGGTYEHFGRFMTVHNAAHGVRLYGLYIESNAGGGDTDDIYVGDPAETACDSFLMQGCFVILNNANAGVTRATVHFDRRANGCAVRDTYFRRLFNGANPHVKITRTGSGGSGGYLIDNCVFASGGSGSYNAIETEQGGGLGPTDITVLNCRQAQDAGARACSINIVTNISRVFVANCDMGLTVAAGCSDVFYHGLSGTITDSDRDARGRQPIGYSAGGGAVTQITSITTGVTTDSVCGQITTVSATLAAGAEATFTVTDVFVDAQDVVLVAVGSYAGAGLPVVHCTRVAAGAFDITISNLDGAAALNAAIVINFAVIKAVNT